MTTHWPLLLADGDWTEHAGAGGDPVNSASPRSHPGRILVVEDDPEAAGYVLHVLRGRGGFEVTHVAEPGRRAGPGPGGTLGPGADRRGDARHDRHRAAGAVRRDSPAAAGGRGHRAPVGRLRGPGAAQQGRRVPGEAGPPGPAGRTVAALVAKGRAAREAARQSVLAIGAHPDDVEIGAAGTLLVHRRMGHEVAILTLSRGARGGAEDTRAGESRRRPRSSGPRCTTRTCRTPGSARATRRSA